MKYYIGIDTLDLDDGDNGSGIAFVFTLHERGWGTVIVEEVRSTDRKDFKSKVKELKQKYPGAETLVWGEI